MSTSATPTLKEDLSTLIKLRLNTFVLITAFFGYLLGWKSSGATFSWEAVMALIHTLFGTACSAFGAAVFNQVMEVKSDAKMERTSNRPLPARRILPHYAFALGWGLCAIGVVHLGAMISFEAALLAFITIGTYVFIYTPMKRVSSVNTLIGAIPGAIPPMMGWVGAGHNLSSWAPWFLFALLFLWQLPHFVAINWLCRQEYEDARYEMWSNGDTSGKRSAYLYIIFSVMMVLLPLPCPALGLTGWVFPPIGMLLAVFLILAALKFLKTRERIDMRKAFFATLIYLPVVLSALAFDWN